MTETETSTGSRVAMARRLDLVVDIPPMRPGRFRRRLDTLSHGLMWAIGAISFVFLLAPMVVIVLASFNRAPALSVPPQHWSLSAYSSIPSVIYQAFVFSIELAVIASAVSMLIAVPVTFWLVRTRGTRVRVADTFFRSPLQVPQIVLGLSLYQSFVIYQEMSGVSLRATFLGLVIAHIILVTPYVISTCVSSLEGRGRDPELAAANLGASPLRVVLQVSLPGIRQGLIAAGMMATLVSFDNVPLSLFLVGSNATPLPVELFTLAEQNLTPTLYAAATLTVLFSIILTALLEKFVGLRNALQR
jgi:putative spermidine/putrescine transport system permease protein